MCEGYVRGISNPSHSETPLHKGFSKENVRDGGFFVMKLSNTQHLFLNTRPLLNNKWLLAEEKVPPWE